MLKTRVFRTDQSKDREGRNSYVKLVKIDSQYNEDTDEDVEYEQGIVINIQLRWKISRGYSMRFFLHNPRIPEKVKRYL